MESSAEPEPHIAKLTKGMEHMRPYVSVPQKHNPSPHPDNSANHSNPTPDPDTTYGVPNSLINPIPRPSSRTPSDGPKRTDPFQFGSRFLEEGDDVFDFNAWDHVEVDEGFKAFAEEQYQRQRDAPVDEVERAKITANPEKSWDKFYKANTSKFFKNRRWLFQEFPALKAATIPVSLGDDISDSTRKQANTIVELGAGAGNTVFPILTENQNEDLHIHALDFSFRSINVIKETELYSKYSPKHLTAAVWDLASPELPETVTPGSVDIVIMIFVFSALAPNQWDQALRNVWKMLRPGGEVLFRDYGKGDLAQVRFKAGRWLEESFYVRGDGTRVYFFEDEELRRIWSGQGMKGRNKVRLDKGSSAEEDRSETGIIASTQVQENEGESTPNFEVVALAADRRMLVNRKRKLKMYRCWMQGRFRKTME